MICAANILFAQKKFNDSILLQPVEVFTVKATDKNPFAKTNLDKELIKKLNIGQDLPFILNNTPSVVVNSDAGNGIGYTGIRIRGTDATRVNVTLNGIPYNDAESLGTFFVDMPDIASSAGSIQLQRGVGTSANGAGSFGGSINVSTNEINRKKNIEWNSAAGSYGSFKSSIIYNSGIFSNHFLVDARVSSIRSDGYIDRASSRLKSFYVSGAYVNEKSSLRLNIFSGKERTYQAYYGVDEMTLDTNRTYNSAGTEKPDVPYENQVDDYTQTHYQLFYNKKINNLFKINVASFLTRGKGYYEQYKVDQKLSKYGLQPVGTITRSDLARRLWLDNYFYGTIFSLQYEKQKTQIILGGGFNKYDGAHYGTVAFTKVNAFIPANNKYYDFDAYKKDFSGYIKWTQKLHKNVETFVDLQVRNVQYNIYGFKDNPTLIVKNDYSFFNPKFGITYSKNKLKLYASYAKATKEPNRDDFETAAAQQPTPEKLHDVEFGFEYKANNYAVGTNFYYMFYKDQLVLNGKINDVGAFTRTNIGNSYRAGMEIFGNAKINDIFSLSGNVTVSKNIVKDFSEYLYRYDSNYEIDSTVINVYKKSTIAYSPNVIGSLTLNIVPFTNAYIGFTSKYVSKQYLDNTANNNRKLQSFFTQDVRTSYSIKSKKINAIDLFVQVNNLFSKKYEPNGYTYSGIEGNEIATYNYYFPVAPINYMVGVNIKL
jgi:iron complex outermembrane recepter protein